MRKTILFILLLFSQLATAQLVDDFSDGDFLLNPMWTSSANNVDFIVLNKQLRSNSSLASSNFSISTANTLALNSKWEFWINLQFNTSGTNYVDIYLIADKADLKSSSINGYFVRIGNTNDEICLYKRSGLISTSVKLIDGVNGTTNTSNSSIRVRVVRNNEGLFTLERDLSGAKNSYFMEGNSVDLDFTSSSFFGIYIQQSTASFFQKHFFDDFKIEALVSDKAPPELISVTSLDSNFLDIAFNEAMDSLGVFNPMNYSLENHSGSIALIQATSDPTRFKIKLSKALNTGNYTLKVNNVKDKAGNTIQDKNSASFVYKKPYKAQFRDIVINEIFADPAPQIDLPSVEFIEILNTSNDTVSMQNWRLSDPSSSGALGNISISPNSYLILCAKSDTAEFKKFGNALGISPWPSLNNSSDVIQLRDPLNVLIDSISYSDNWHSESLKKQGGWSLERINPKSICEGIFNWTSSKDPSGGTPGKQNSTFIENFDQMTFKADSIKQVSDSTILVHLNKPPRIESIIKDDFSLLPISGQIKEINSSGVLKQITLTFSEKFKAGTTYQLSVSGIKDCSGNTLSSSTPFTFSIPALPPPPPPPPVPPVRVDSAQVFITEIFADPSPEVGLPLVEFIEIFNPGKDTLDLEGWTINDPQTKGNLKKYLLPPNQYLIICPAADTTQYKSFGRTLGVSPWPSLNNSSDQIVLKSFRSRTVDSISFSDTWYADPIKKQGGWSLERIDHLSKCIGQFIWTASKDLTGGTPGKQNSSYVPNYDQLILKADSLNRFSDSTLLVYFNKPLNDSTLIKESFSLSPASGQIKEINSSGVLKQITLTFSEKFKAGTTYQLSINGIKDCSGNTFSSSSPFSFSIPALPPPPPPPPVPPVRVDSAQVFITEIFADPSPEVGLPLVEFIEIFNPGKDTLDLEEWTINDPQTKGNLKKYLLPPNQYLIICPAADTTQYKSFGRTLGVSPWPSLKNNSDEIVLKSFRNRVVDSISFSDTWYADPIKKQGGWSLERIDHLSKCIGQFIWTASKDQTGGTPGKQNSTYIPNYDRFSFKADSINRSSDTSVIVYFNKPPNPSSTNKNQFLLVPNSGQVKQINIYGDSKRLGVTFSEKFKAGTTYQLSIDGIKDCSGNTLSSSTPFSFSIPALPPPPPPPPIPPVRVDTARIFITEIFADPSPEVGLPLVEFIELYNPGKDTLDLEGWTINDPQTKGVLKKYLLPPNQYLIICPAADTTQYKSFGRTLGVSPWPSLKNNSDEIVLKSFKSRTVDSVSYSENWYKNPTKISGGWSLERINLTNKTCNGFYNWGASLDSLGGTPGRKNSRYNPEFSKMGLKIDSLKIISENSINVYFNQIPDTSYLRASNFSIKNGIEKANLIQIAASKQEIRLFFDEKFKEGEQYFLSADSLISCSGNLTRGKDAIGSFEIPAIAEIEYPIVINEIFADPSPVIDLPEMEFIELFNPTDRPVKLQGLSLGKNLPFKKGEIEAGAYLILCAEKDTLSFKPYGKVIGMPLWTSLNNQKDSIQLKNNKGRIIQQVNYSSAWHRDTEKRKGGYSLELIDYQSLCPDLQNWVSSKDSTGGTPGRKNSVHQKNTSSEGLKLVGIEVLDSLSLSLQFNREIDSLKASFIVNYSLNNGAGRPDFALAQSPNFDRVILKFNQALSRGQTYRLTANNIGDCNNVKLSADFNYAEFHLAPKIQKNDVLLSEILFNPRAGGSDFVEIYNHAAYSIDLKELSLAQVTKDSINSIQAISRKQYLLEPGKYLALSINPANIKKEYFANSENNIHKMEAMPAFNDDMGTAVLLSNGKVIDQLTYSEKMHFPLLKNIEGTSLERSKLKSPANEGGNLRSATMASGGATPGYQNSQNTDEQSKKDDFALVSKTFSPDNDGFEDLFEISYRSSGPGDIATISIFNNQGTLIKNLVKNYTLNMEGTLIWDGLNDYNQMSPVGIYILQAEIFNLKGKIKRFRKSFALVSKFK